jgi:DNA polymerase III epsilon subunit-like protein
VFFDLETTGVDAKTARIIEVSVAKHLPDGTVESKTRRFNPGIPISLFWPYRFPSQYCSVCHRGCPVNACLKESITPW